MKFGSFHDDGGLYFADLELEDNSESDNKVLFFAPGSTDPVLYEGERALWCAVSFPSSNCDLSLCRCSEAEGVV